MELKENINYIAKNWSNYRKFCRKKVKTTPPQIWEVEKPDHELIRNLEKFSKSLEQNIDKNRYKVQWSVGEGRLNQSPWVAIMDKKITTTPRSGYYVAYLFTTDLKKLYLCIALGVTQFDRLYRKTQDGLMKISEASKQVQNMFEHLRPSDFSKNNDLLEF